jgi:hypothetical protein
MIAGAIIIPDQLPLQVAGFSVQLYSPRSI